MVHLAGNCWQSCFSLIPDWKKFWFLAFHHKSHVCRRPGNLIMINTANEWLYCIFIITTATNTMILSGVGTAALVCRLQHQSLQLKKLNRFPSKKKENIYIHCFLFTLIIQLLFDLLFSYCGNCFVHICIVLNCTCSTTTYIATQHNQWTTIDLIIMTKTQYGTLMATSSLVVLYIIVCIWTCVKGCVQYCIDVTIAYTYSSHHVLAVWLISTP